LLISKAIQILHGRHGVVGPYHLHAATDTIEQPSAVPELPKEFKFAKSGTHSINDLQFHINIRIEVYLTNRTALLQRKETRTDERQRLAAEAQSCCHGTVSVVTFAPITRGKIVQRPSGEGVAGRGEFSLTRREKGAKIDAVPFRLEYQATGFLPSRDN